MTLGVEHEAPASLPDARSGSPFARYGLLCYAALLIYGSLFPWTGWRDLGVPALAFVSAAFPQYWSWREIVANLLAYLPLGVLLVLSLRPLRHGAVISALAISTCSGLSFSLEAAQTFMPGRIASNVDWAVNTLGGCLGAWIGHRWAGGLIESGWLPRMRQRWFEPAASAALLWAGLWIVAQAAPQTFAFATGDATRWLGAWIGRGFDWFGLIWWPTPEQHVHAQVAAAAASVLGAALFLSLTAHKRAPRARLTLTLLAAAVGFKTGVYGLLVPGAAWRWLTPGAISGLALGLLTALALVHAPRRVMGLLCVAALIVQMLIVNLWPTNVYFAFDDEGLGGSGWLHLTALLQTLSCLWPLGALFWLLRRADSRRVKSLLPG